MSHPLLIPLPGNEEMASRICAGLHGQQGRLEIRQFPDGETYLRYLDDPAGRRVVVVCTLDHPDDKILPLLFAAGTARELGAAGIGLISPYLAYMRQDRRFNPGEAVTSREFASLISGAFDWLITVDPHLHRYGALAEIYSVPTRVIHAAPLVAEWIRANVPRPLIIGPDSESEQWVAATARKIDAPFTVLEKIRRGDRDVEVLIQNAARLTDRTPVFVDDIISTGRTMIEAVRLARKQTSAVPVCIAVHGLFADGADRLLGDAGARVVTCNTVRHATNAIDVTPILIEAVPELAAEWTS